MAVADLRGINDFGIAATRIVKGEQSIGHNIEPAGEPPEIFGAEKASVNVGNGIHEPIGTEIHGVGADNEQGEIQTIQALPRLVKIEGRVAEDTGVAFFNTFQAMGGDGTMARWYASEPRLVGSDYIHPMPAGARIVGELLYGSLRDGYNEYKLRQLKNREGSTTK